MELDALRVIGRISSTLIDPAAAPKQGDEGAPEATIEISADYEPALQGVSAGDELLVLTWLEAIDGTPVLDLKPVLEAVGER